MAENAFECGICAAKDSNPLSVREMMFGMRDVFTYQHCQTCGCLQISEIPENISTYYPNNYYSFPISKKRKRWLRDLLRKSRSLYAIERRGLFGAMLARLKKPDALFEVYGRVGVTREDSVLDIGGGGGGHIQSLIDLGFENALAIDPFIEDNVEIGGRIIARKAAIFEITERFDLITFHHSFEHMDQQQRVLEKARDLLTETGKILIRIPTVSSDAFETYGTHWASLDAPRHFYLHSHKSIAILAEQAGLKIDDLWCDSESFQFWGSEQYARDIPLNDPLSYAENPENSIFTAGKINEFKDRAQTLNAAMQGDAICVVLTVG